jgi:hypothetical protein
VGVDISSAQLDTLAHIDTATCFKMEDPTGGAFGSWKEISEALASNFYNELDEEHPFYALRS